MLPPELAEIAERSGGGQFGRTDVARLVAAYGDDESIALPQSPLHEPRFFHNPVSLSSRPLSKNGRNQVGRLEHLVDVGALVRGVNG